MRRIFAMAALMAVAIVPATVLAGSAESGASVASSQATTPLKWHVLVLTNGWSTTSPSRYGSPAWAVSNGVVYLRGVVQGGIGADLAKLPRGARPAHWLWITYVTSGPTTSGMLIRPTGLISLFGPGDAKTFSSLSGVSFPVKA